MSAPVDVLAVMAAEADEALRFRRDHVLGNFWTAERLQEAKDASSQARAAVAELVRLVDYAKDTHPEGCFREDCAAALARIGGAK